MSTAPTTSTAGAPASAPTRRSRWLRTAATLSAAAALVVGGAAVATAATTDGFNADPVRLLDTRIDLPDHPKGQIQTFTQVVMPDSVPADGTALLSVTVVKPRTGGYVKVYPNGSQAPATADVNFVAGPTWAQEVLVSPGTNGAVNLAVGGNAGPIDLVVDLVGSFPQASYTSLDPSQRIFDTRAPGTGTSSGKKPAGAYPVVLPSSVPRDATAVAITLTQANADGDGYLTARSGTRSTGTSSVNYTRSSVASNLVWVRPVNGRFVVAVTGAATNIIVDVKGYSTSQNVQAFDAQRVADSRRGTGGLSGVQRGLVGVTLPSSVPAGAKYALLNVTVTGTTGGGFVASYQAQPGELQISNINYDKGQTVAGFLLAPINASGKATFYIAFSPTQVVVDVEGYVTNAPTEG